MNCVPSPCLSWISDWIMQLFCQKQSDLLWVWECFICGGNIPWLLPGFTWGWEVVTLFSRSHQIACAFWCCFLIYLKTNFLVFLVLGTCEGWVGNKSSVSGQISTSRLLSPGTWSTVSAWCWVCWCGYILQDRAFKELQPGIPPQFIFSGIHSDEVWLILV